jgi:heat shock protein HslJ
MKKIATTVLLACAFLGAGCSDPATTQSGPNPTLTPAPDYTIEEMAAMKDASPTNESQPRVEAQQAVLAPTVRPDRVIEGKLIEASPTP